MKTILIKNTILDIRNEFCNKFLNKDFVIDKSGVKTIDILDAVFHVDEDFIFSLPNKEYIENELQWYLSQSLNVMDLNPTPKIWAQVADKFGFINSNYGWCILSSDNHNQYENCKNELIKNPLSRRATMIYNRPEMWNDYNKGGRSDFMCTYATQYFIREGKLLTSVYMRSNDAVFGFRNDYAWQLYVSEKLANDLGIEMGDMTWHAGSLHMYESSFYLLDHYIKTSEPHITLKNYKELYNI